MIGTTISHYEILDELGRGGMGVVYRAKDSKLDRTVALKFLPKEVSGNELSKQRFMTEARASAKLTHANICAIHEVNEEDDQLFMVMECIEGVTLKERHAQLRERAIARGETSLSHHLNRRLDDLVHYGADELEEALEALTEGLDYRLSRFVIKHLLTNDGLVRSTRAEVLAGLGRYEEAIITYRSLNDGFDWLDSGWEGPGFLRRAQWYEELGDIDSAIDFYGRFVELWAEADPHLQPQVEDARERLDELVIQQAGEPQN